MTATRIEVLGIDLGKNWFHVVGIDARGKELKRRKLSRAKLREFAAQLPRCVVAMESCAGSQYWGRVFASHDHEVRIIPSQFVKPYVKSNKNDFNDAGAIAEAASRGSMRFVPLKSDEQLELQALHRVRERLVGERTAIINQMRGFLMEHGLVVAKGRVRFSKEMPRILEDAENGLSLRLRALVDRLRRRWREHDEEIDEVTAELHHWAQNNEHCRRLCTIPGIGPIISTALVAAVGNGQAFGKARDMAAWVGIVPKQLSTGGKSRLVGISKRGNTYLRKQLIHGARSLVWNLNREKTRLGRWIAELQRRAHHNVVIVAVANKLVRMCWKILTCATTYRDEPLPQT